jgi:hypothetical protein
MPDKTPGKIAVQPDEYNNHRNVQEQNDPLKAKDRAKVYRQQHDKEFVALQPDKPYLFV